MFITIVAILIATTLIAGIALFVSSRRSPASSFSASLMVFTAAVGAGIGWAAAMIASAVCVTALVAASNNGDLEKLFSLTGSVPVQIAKYAALVIAAGVTAMSVSAALTVGSNLIRAREFSPAGEFGNWLDAAPPWLKWWERSIARPARDFTDRVRTAGFTAAPLGDSRAPHAPAG